MTDRERGRFLADPRGVTLSVADDRGRPPHATPVWYASVPGGDITVFTGTRGRFSRQAGPIERARAVTLSVQRAEFPYAYVTVEGTVVGVDRPPVADRMLAIARRYMPDEMAQGFVAAELDHPGPGFVLFTVRPDRWLTVDFADDGG